MKKLFLLSVALVVLALIFPVLGQSKDFPIAYPFSSWGEVRLSSNSDVEESFVFDSYFEQGVDWWKIYNWTFNSYAAVHFIQGSESDYYWDNKLNPIIGIKVKHPFKIFPEAWGEIDLGVRGEYYNYTKSSADDDFLLVPFAQWTFGGDWKKNKKEEKTSSFPLGYPFSSWGEIRYSKGDINEGLVLDCYFEQGADLYRWHRATLNSFVGLRVTQSSEDDDYWNNKIGPWFGVKVKHPFNVFPRAWGEVDLGVRGEYYGYTNSPTNDNEFRVVLFLQWSFGGDWKNF